MTDRRNDDVGAEVRRVLRRVLRLSEATLLSGDTPLLEGGLGFNSLAGMEIIVDLEYIFGFEFAMSELTRETFATVDSLVDLVERKVRGGKALAG